MQMFSILLVVHVLLATAGYAGLIATHAYTLFLSRSRSVEPIRAGLAAWRNSSQTFGPLLGLGVLAGFALAGALHVPFASRWLVITYILIVLALSTHAAIAIPWQIRSNRSLALGTIPPMGPLRFTVAWMSLLYTAIIFVMLTRPA